MGGREEEDDDSYRYRINLRLHSQGGAEEPALRLAILQVPGVQDVDFERQAGTFTAYVYGISPVVPPSLLQLVQAQIDDRVAYPLTGLAVAPDLIGISLATTIKLAPKVAAGESGVVLGVARRLGFSPSGDSKLLARARDQRRLGVLARR